MRKFLSAIFYLFNSTVLQFYNSIHLHHSTFYILCLSPFYLLLSTPFSYLTTSYSFDYQVFVRLHFDAFSKTFIHLKLISGNLSFMGVFENRPRTARPQHVADRPVRVSSCAPKGTNVLWTFDERTERSARGLTEALWNIYKK
jgi:hypothetical protein